MPCPFSACFFSSSAPPLLLLFSQKMISLSHTQLKVGSHDGLKVVCGFFFFSFCDEPEVLLLGITLTQPNFGEIRRARGWFFSSPH